MARKVTYWVTTILLAVTTLPAAFAYLSGSPQAVQGFAHVGSGSKPASVGALKRASAKVLCIF
jgi:hypothetical protein